ncbi:hypothetical protein [Ekhidna sp.]|uniref:hypothetical protein n=1 Tax=Ekhidna sp. TaxID=2608089 RepID=UPI003517A2BF
MDNLSSIWWEDGKMLLTKLSGDVGICEIQIWENCLKDALNQIADNSKFKMFVNLFGFKADSVEAHKYYRSIIPTTLSHYGWRIGYLDMFEEANDLELTNTRGISCVGAAHVHQDASKIDKYQELYATDREQYFTDPDQAYHWIEDLSLDG